MRCWAVLFSAIVLVACTDNERVPDDVIPKKRMEKILWDMVVADRFVNSYIVRPGDSTGNKQQIAKVYAQVFSIHGITEAEFLKSYKFYLSRPDITRVMFDSIAAKAERRKAEIYQPKNKDSLLQSRDSLRSRDSALKPRPSLLRNRDSVLKTRDSLRRNRDRPAESKPLL